MSDTALHIQSFRVVFDLERRIHRIDRFKVPLPYGLPLRSVGYTAAALLAVLVLSGLPLTGAVVDAIPTPLRLVLAPIAVGMTLTKLRLDGRSAHAAAAAWLRFSLNARDLTAFRRQAGCGPVRLADIWTVYEPEPKASHEDDDARTGSEPGNGRPVNGIEQLSLLIDDQLVLW